MKNWFVLITTSVLVLGIAHGLEWVPFESGQPEQAPEFRVLSSNSFRTVVELELAGMYVDEVEANGRTFQTISLGIEAGGMTREEGAPRLPVVARFLRIPDDRAVEVNVLELEESVLEGYEVYPAQPPLPENQTSVPFVLNEKRYATDAFYPDENERVSEPMIMRDFRLVQLVLQPARFNPVTGELRMARSLRVELVHNRPGAINVKQRNRSGISRAFEPLYRRLIANYDFGPPQQPEDGSYLIITHDDFASAVVPFAEWKRRKGWRTVVVTTSDIGGNDSAHIDACITDAYNNWPYPPDYVLLVGDAPGYVQCCHMSGNTCASDLPYSLKEGGDLLADLMIARVCAENLFQAQTAMNKLYKYEKEPYMADTDWFGKASALAAWEHSGRFWTVVIRIRNYVMGRPFIQFDTLFARWGLNGKQALIDSIELGRAWLLYRGHGAIDAWGAASPSFTTTDVHALNNGEMLPTVIGPTCLAGDFDNPTECLAESFVKAGTPTVPSGGTGYFGSSEVSYSGYNDTLALGCFMSHVDSLQSTFGQNTFFAKLLMLQAYPLPDPTSENELWIFNTMGEPELNVWSAVPQALLVSHPAMVIVGSFPFEVTVNATDGYAPVENALVCVMSKTDTALYHVGHTNSAGSVQFTLNATVPGDSIFVTVTGRNLHPYLGAAMTISPSSAYVTYLSHFVSDSAPGGNGDGIVNPGETIVLPTWVKNWGSVTADSVSGMMLIADVNVTLLDSVKRFGSIAPDDSAHTGIDGYEFTVAGACTNGYVLDFDFECRDANDSLWLSGVNLWVGTPVLDYTGYVVSDPPPGGNGDGKIDAGETAQLSLVLDNNGLGHGYNVTGILRSGDVRFQVQDSAGDFGDILHDSTGSNSADPFVVHAGDSIPMETPVPCTLLVSADGYSKTIPFTLMVGEIRAVDPIPDTGGPTTLYWAYDDCDTFYTEHPTFGWVEVSGTGTRLDLGDDDVEQVNLPTGFGPFVYYGQTYTQLSVCSNGFVAPGYSTYTQYTNQSLPCAAAPPILAASWDDFDPEDGGGGGVWYYHDAANHRFIVEWDSVVYWNSSEWDKLQIILYDTTLAAADGNCEFTYQYLSANRIGTRTVGEQDHTKTTYIQALFDGSYHRGSALIEAGRAIKFTTAGPVTGLAEGDLTPAGIGRAGFAVWPNPVRDRAWVRFGLRREARVNLAVYDLSGRQVRSLVRTSLKPGNYSIDWDGKDAHGRTLAHGVYFVRLDTDGEQLVKKAIVLE